MTESIVILAHNLFAHAMHNLQLISSGEIMS